MSYFSDNGINFGDDQYIATPGEVPGLIKNFKNKRVILPEEMARAEQYGISLNVPCTNTRDSLIYANDRYGTQTQFDLDDQTRYGTRYNGDLPALMFKDPKVHYDDVIPQRRRDQGTAYNTDLPVRHCKKSDKFYEQGRDPVPTLDKRSMSNWQPCQDSWGGVYPLQERMTNSLSDGFTDHNIILLFIFIIFIAVMFNIMKTREINKMVSKIFINQITEKK